MHVIQLVDRLRAQQPRALAPAALTVLAASLALLAGCASPPPPPPEAAVPDSLRSAADTLQETLTAAGDQVYRCHRVPAADTAVPGAAGATGATASQTLRWQPYGPEATLRDASGENVGSVAPGRYFLAYDGSFAVGKIAAATVMDANALPWVRYAIHASTRAGNGEGGRMTDVSAVIRIKTRGGMPASDVCHTEGTQLYVPYFATYLLYRSTPPAQTLPVVPSPQLLMPTHSRLPRIPAALSTASVTMPARRLPASLLPTPPLMAAAARFAATTSVPLPVAGLSAHAATVETASVDTVPASSPVPSAPLLFRTVQ